MSEQEIQTEEAQSEQEQTAGDQTEQQEAPAEEAKEPTLEEKYAELEAQNAKLKDDYLRKVADFDNYRKRMIREKQEAFDYANTAILTDLVATLDDFDRGIAAAESATDVKTILDGIKMINRQMHGFLDSKYNLTSYCEAGDAFDPNLHEAIASAEADVSEPVCAQVYQRGYKLKDRVIRHAKVMVHMPKAAQAQCAEDSADAGADSADAAATEGIAGGSEPSA